MCSSVFFGGGSRGTTSEPTVRNPPSEECRKCKKGRKSSPRPPAAVLPQTSSSDSGRAVTHVCLRHPLPPVSRFALLLSYIRELNSQHIPEHLWSRSGSLGPALWNVSAGREPPPPSMIRLTFHQFRLTFRKVGHRGLDHNKHQLRSQVRPKPRQPL